MNERERPRVLGLLQAEYEWLSRLEIADDEIAKLARILTVGTLSNLMRAVLDESSVDEYREQIKVREYKRFYEHE